MKIAIACSGLGHVHRGIETWAADLARALHEAGEDVTLFQGSGETAEDWQTVLPCQKRFDPKNAGVGSAPETVWRLALRLWLRLRDGADDFRAETLA